MNKLLCITTLLLCMSAGATVHRVPAIGRDRGATLRNKINTSFAYLYATQLQVELNVTDISGINENVTYLLAAQTADRGSIGTLITTTENNASRISTLEDGVDDLSGIEADVFTQGSLLGVHTTELDTLSGSLAVNSGILASHSSSISTHTGDIIDNTSAVSGLESSMATANSSISANATSIGAQATSLASHTATLSSHTTSIANNSSGVAANFTLIESLAPETSGIAINAAAIAINTDSIQGMQPTLDNNTQTIYGQGILLSTHTYDISTINTLALVNQSDISALETSTIGFTDDVTDLDNRVTYIEDNGTGGGVTPEDYVTVSNRAIGSEQLAQKNLPNGYAGLDENGYLSPDLIAEVMIIFAGGEAVAP